MAGTKQNRTGAHNRRGADNIRKVYTEVNRLEKEDQAVYTKKGFCLSVYRSEGPRQQLPVSQRRREKPHEIKERVTIFLPLQLFLGPTVLGDESCNSFRFCLVEAPDVEMHDKSRGEENEKENEETNLARKVLSLVLGLEHLRPGGISSRESQEEQSVDDGAL